MYCFLIYKFYSNQKDTISFKKNNLLAQQDCSKEQKIMTKNVRKIGLKGVTVYACRVVI